MTHETDVQELRDVLEHTQDALRRALAERDEVGVQLKAAQVWAATQMANWGALRELIARWVTNDSQRADLLRAIDMGVRATLKQQSDEAERSRKEKQSKPEDSCAAEGEGL